MLHVYRLLATLLQEILLNSKIQAYEGNCFKKKNNKNHDIFKLNICLNSISLRNREVCTCMKNFKGVSIFQKASLKIIDRNYTYI